MLPDRPISGTIGCGGSPENCAPKNNGRTPPSASPMAREGSLRPRRGSNRSIRSSIENEEGKNSSRNLPAFIWEEGDGVMQPTASLTGRRHPHSIEGIHPVVGVRVPSLTAASATGLVMVGATSPIKSQGEASGRFLGSQVKTTNSLSSSNNSSGRFGVASPLRPVAFSRFNHSRFAQTMDKGNEGHVGNSQLGTPRGSDSASLTPRAVQPSSEQEKADLATQMVSRSKTDFERRTRRVAFQSNGSFAAAQRSPLGSPGPSNSTLQAHAAARQPPALRPCGDETGACPSAPSSCDGDVVADDFKLPLAPLNIPASATAAAAEAAAQTSSFAAVQSNADRVSHEKGGQDMAVRDEAQRSSLRRAASSSVAEAEAAVPEGNPALRSFHPTSAPLVKAAGNEGNVSHSNTFKAPNELLAAAMLPTATSLRPLSVAEEPAGSVVALYQVGLARFLANSILRTLL